MTESGCDPTIVVRGTLSPSTISLSSPDLSSTEIVLDLEIYLRNTSDYITLFTPDCFLHSGHESYYSSNYVLYSLKTHTEVSHGVMHVYRTNRIPIKNPEETLLELEPPSESGTSEHFQTLLKEQKPVQIKIKLGMHTDTPAKVSGAKAAIPKASSDDCNQPIAQPTQVLRPDLVICASPLDRLVPGEYQIKIGNYPSKHIWWWKRGKKADILASASLRDRTGLMGPVTIPQTGETVYGVERMSYGNPSIKVDFVDPPILKVVP